MALPTSRSDVQRDLRLADAALENRPAAVVQHEFTADQALLKLQAILGDNFKAEQITDAEVIE
jgi:hypothetical protein